MLQVRGLESAGQSMKNLDVVPVTGAGVSLPRIYMMSSTTSPAQAMNNRRLLDGDALQYGHSLKRQLSISPGSLAASPNSNQQFVRPIPTFKNSPH